jgi:hypothetical protein
MIWPAVYCCMHPLCYWVGAEPQNTEHRRRMEHRTRMVTGASPEVLRKARGRAFLAAGRLDDRIAAAKKHAKQWGDVKDDQGTDDKEGRQG